MSKPIKILAFSGSTRNDSLNKKTVAIAARGARAAGAEVELIDLRDYAMPIYEGDLEDAEGLPEGAKALREKFFEAQGLLISSPEYNGSLPPVLKNTIDWLSRTQEGETPLLPYQGKAAVIMAASPGGLGGVRVLAHLRQILSNVGVLVLPEQRGLAKAHEYLDGDGALTDPKQVAALEGLGARLATFLAQQNKA